MTRLERLYAATAEGSTIDRHAHVLAIAQVLERADLQPTVRERRELELWRRRRHLLAELDHEAELAADPDELARRAHALAATRRPA